MAHQTASRVFQFGVFEVNETAAELRKRGVRIKLHSQPFQILVMLLEKPGELVTRKEMQQRLWGNDETFVDFEHGLNTAINKIREALDDSAAQPRYVETVPGKGYRFVAPVTLSPTPEAETPAPPPAVLTTSHELPQASRRVVAILLLLIQAMYLAFYFGALANLPEIREIFFDANILPPAGLIAVLVTSACILIPMRLFLFAAVAFDFSQLRERFHQLFPLLLPLDLLWSLSPFLLVHHVNTGLAMGITAALVYLPFAQRSLILMFRR